MEQYFNQFDWAIMNLLGLDSLPADYNPITRALREDDQFTDKVCQVKKSCREALSRLAVLCQVNLFNNIGGPDNDGKPKPLRRHWYAYFKTEFAQPFSEQLGEDIQAANWSRNWDQRISDVYNKVVHDEGITYKDLWVSDASRLMDVDNERLFSECHIIVAIEKDSLFDDFSDAAKRLGARVLYSGSGKSSAAAIEKVLMSGFGWSKYDNPFSEASPLYVIHVSDYDYDGEAVIGPTFGEQCRHYTPHIREARIGIEPHQVIDAGHSYEDKWYQIKVVHNGSQEWADNKAIEGRYGFEVEALRTPDYYPLLVDALLTILDFDQAVEAMRAECTPDEYDAANSAYYEIIEANEEYTKLRDKLAAYEGMVQERLNELARIHVADIEPPTDEPTPGDYKEHVVSNGSWVWRPFSQRRQTAALRDFLLDNYSDELNQIELED